MTKHDLSTYQKKASEAAKPGPQHAPGGAARSSYEETTFGANAGSGPNRSRNVHKKPGVK
jgi:hypothetical protein